MKTLFFCLFLFIANSINAQGYTDSLRMFRHHYITTHEVVKGQDIASLQFFEVKPEYRVMASFEKKNDMPWFQMATSGTIKKMYRVYGNISFVLGGNSFTLPVYQSQDLLDTDYSTYLFLPFTDVTNGNETYATGRYIDLKMEDISNGQALIDFNKAYNPYCAYVDGRYSCPIPPKENHLAIEIKAGEKNFVREK